MRTFNFAKRSFKEIIRDPLSIIFAILLPLFLLVLFQQFNIPNESYRLENFTPGIVIFGFSFISMFTATLVARDRSTALLIRLGVSPMRSLEYVFGYALAVIPVVMLQCALFYTAALIMKLPLGIGVLYSVLLGLPISVLFIAIGILLGSLTGANASAGISSIVIQLVAFTSGMYFDGDMVGKGFSVICKLLPFSGALDIMRAALGSAPSGLLLSVITVMIYTVLISSAAVLVFSYNLKNAR